MARDCFAGVMSGTSLDGVDAVVADFAPSGGKPCKTLGAAHVGLPTMLRDELLALQQPGSNELARAGAAANMLEFPRCRCPLSGATAYDSAKSIILLCCVRNRQ